LLVFELITKIQLWKATLPRTGR